MSIGTERGTAAPLMALPRQLARQPIGEILTRRAGLAPETVAGALALQAQAPAPLGEILRAQGAVGRDAVTDALAWQHGLEWVDPAARPPDPRAAEGFDPAVCLRHGFVPLWRDRGALVIATAFPERLGRIADALPPGCGPARLVHASEPAVQGAIARLWRDRLAALAETRCPPADSCRGWAGGARRRVTLTALAIAAALALAGPAAAGAAVLAFAVLAMLANTTLKLAAALGAAGRRNTPAPAVAPTRVPLPRISVLIPLFREAAILPDLIARLDRIDYPRALFDVCLVVEADDRATRAVLARAARPAWLRMIAVPPGALRTKPRALNYALGFCRGDIVGVWDAEDAPAPGQLRAVAARFAADPGGRLACVQGTLDFYNRRENWLARCFTIEYAIWFRIVLTGLARLGLPFPLGGTTMFIRREVLEQVGGWDAHNVTEDADLGIRLHRRGWRCALIDSVTEEEANCTLPDWIRQRSRWLKGFAITWGTHMRRPGALWRDLGPAGFAAFQVIFLGGVLGFLLAPAVWSFWLVPVFGTVPFAPWLPGPVQWGLFAAFILAEGINLAIAMLALGAPAHRFLRLWVPTMHLYFPLAALAAWRGLHEVMTRPFYWAKTPHGLRPGADAAGETAPRDAAPPARQRA